MADLDVEIDVPDDDDLDPPVRVVDGGLIPPWLKGVLVAVAGTALAVTVAAYLFGRSRSADDLSGAVTVPSTMPETETSALDSAPAFSGIERSQEAVDAWQAFARTGDLAPLADYFDPAGPQYALFTQQAEQAEQAGQAGEVSQDGAGEQDPSSGPEFTARNLSETTSDGVLTVSLDMAVSGPDGETVYPYQFVYVGDDSRVWTVIDRRSPGTLAVPPPQATIELAQQNWATFTTAVAGGDGAGAAAVVSEATRELATAVADAVASGDTTPPEGVPLSDPALFGVLVERAGTAGATTPDEVLLTMLDAEQQAAMINGGLTLWTQVDPERITASLQVDGQAVAAVPFVASTGGWAFDLAGALGTSEGGSQ